MYAWFVYLRKTFERLNQSLLLEKIKRKGFPFMLVHKVKNIFENIKVCVKYKISFLDEWIVHRGVRQDRVTSAYLFCLYLHILRRNDEQTFGACLA